MGCCDNADCHNHLYGCSDRCPEILASISEVKTLNCRLSVRRVRGLSVWYKTRLKWQLQTFFILNTPILVHLCPPRKTSNRSFTGLYTARLSESSKEHPPLPPPYLQKPCPALTQVQYHSATWNYMHAMFLARDSNKQWHRIFGVSPHLWRPPL